MLNRVGHEMAEDAYFGPLIMEPPRVIGVDSFDDSGIAIKVLGVTKPIRQWDVTRELRRRIKRAFDEEGIEIPFPQRTLHWAPGANPAEAQAPPTAPRRRARRLAGREAAAEEAEHMEDPFVRGRDEQERVRDLQAAMGGADGVAAVDLMAHLDDVREVLAHPPTALFLDIDGTLSQIVPNPSAASISPAVRQALGQLSRRMPVVALTGRSVSAARGIIGLDTITYVGNHGLEWWQNGVGSVLPGAAPYVRSVHDLAVEAGRRLVEISGIVVEDKGPVLALHYRQAVDQAAARDAILSFIKGAKAARDLVMHHGKMVIELRAPVQANKGTALRSVVDREGVRSGLVFGDDLTDIDSFRMVQQLRMESEFQGLSVAVIGSGAPPELLAEADFHVLNTEAVDLFLGWLVKETAPEARSRRGK